MVVSSSIDTDNVESLDEFIFEQTVPNDNTPDNNTLEYIEEFQSDIDENLQSFDDSEAEVVSIIDEISEIEEFQSDIDDSSLSTTEEDLLDDNSISLEEMTETEENFSIPLVVTVDEEFVPDVIDEGSNLLFLKDIPFPLSGPVTLEFDGDMFLGTSPPLESTYVSKSSQRELGTSLSIKTALHVTRYIDSVQRNSPLSDVFDLEGLETNYFRLDQVFFNLISVLGAQHGKLSSKDEKYGFYHTYCELSLYMIGQNSLTKGAGPTWLPKFNKLWWLRAELHPILNDFRHFYKILITKNIVEINDFDMVAKLYSSTLSDRLDYTLKKMFKTFDEQKVIAQTSDILYGQYQRLKSESVDKNTEETVDLFASLHTLFEVGNSINFIFFNKATLSLEPSISRIPAEWMNSNKNSGYVSSNMTTTSALQTNNQLVKSILERGGNELIMRQLERNHNRPN
jgi:hypothetical protein